MHFSDFCRGFGSSDMQKIAYFTEKSIEKHTEMYWGGKRVQSFGLFHTECDFFLMLKDGSWRHAKKRGKK